MNMTKPRLLFLGVLILTSIVSSSCSCFSRSPECPLQGATYGGRLVLVDDAGLSSGLFHSFAHGRRMVIFQRPPGHLLHHGGFGIGQIWIGTGSRSCQGPESQVPEQCPWTGDRPCIDAGIPCETDPPSYDRADPLEFSGVTSDSITISFSTWDETTDHGNGPVIGYKILYRPKGGETFQESLVTGVDGNRISHPIDHLTAGTNYQFQIVLVRDGEPPEGPPSKIQSMQTSCEDLGPIELTFETEGNTATRTARLIVSWQLPNLTTNCLISQQRITLHQIEKDGRCGRSPQNPRSESEILDAGAQTKIFNNIDTNSLFNVTYVATNPSRTYVTSNETLTAEIAPTGKPIDLRHEKVSGGVELEWSAPACGKRHGKITHFNYVVYKNRQETRRHYIVNKKNVRYTIDGLSKGTRWKFELQACNKEGCGPWTMQKGKF